MTRNGSEVSQIISRNWLIFVYAVMQLADTYPDTYVLELYSILFDRPSHLTLEQATSMTHNAQTHRDITYRIAAHPELVSKVKRYAIELSKKLNPKVRPQRANNIEVVKDTGTRRPAVLPGANWSSSFG